MQLYDGAMVTQLPHPLGNADATRRANPLERATSSARGGAQSREPFKKKKKRSRAKIYQVYTRERAHKKRHFKRREKKNVREEKKHSSSLQRDDVLTRRRPKAGPGPQAAQQTSRLGKPLIRNKTTVTVSTTTSLSQNPQPVSNASRSSRDGNG